MHASDAESGTAEGGGAEGSGAGAEDADGASDISGHTQYHRMEFRARDSLAARLLLFLLGSCLLAFLLAVVQYCCLGIVLQLYSYHDVYQEAAVVTIVELCAQLPGYCALYGSVTFVGHVVGIL